MVRIFKCFQHTTFIDFLEIIHNVHNAHTISTTRMWYFVVESESYTLFKSTILITDEGHVSRLGCFIKYEYFICSL